MAKTVTLRLEEDVYEELHEAAVAERRSLSNLIVTAALARIREAQFVDDEEMAQILSDDALLRGLKNRFTTGPTARRPHRARPLCRRRSMRACSDAACSGIAGLGVSKLLGVCRIGK